MDSNAAKIGAFVNKLLQVPEVNSVELTRHSATMLIVNVNNYSYNGYFDIPSLTEETIERFIKPRLQTKLTVV